MRFLKNIIIIGCAVTGCTAAPECPHGRAESVQGPASPEYWLEAGKAHFSREEYGEAVVSFEKAGRLASEQGNLHQEGLAWRWMADTYNRTFNAREDSLYLLRALGAFEEAGDSPHAAETVLRLATAFYNDRKWDKAGRCFHRILDAAEPDSLLLDRCRAGYASFLLDTDPSRAEEALRCLEQAQESSLALSDKKLCDLGYALFLCGREGEASRLWDSLERSHPEGFPLLDYRRYCAEKQVGNTGKALSFLERNSVSQDSLLRAQTSEQVSQARRDYMEAVAEGERILAERERERRRAVLAGGILLSLILALAGLVLLQRERARRATVQQALADSERLVGKLEEATRSHLDKIHSLNRDVRITRSALEAIRSEYLYMLRSGYQRLGRLFEARHFAGSQNRYEETLCRKVGEILKEIDGDPKGSRRLEKFIEDNLDRPISHLKEDIPELKAQDILLFCYLVIGYDASLISLLMGIDNLNTVYSRKHRLIGRIKRLPVTKARRYLDLVA